MATGGLMRLSSQVSLDAEYIGNTQNVQKQAVTLPSLELRDTESDESQVVRCDGYCSSMPSENWEEELEKCSEVMPKEIKGDFIDCLILYAEEDRNGAEQFRTHLINDIKMENHGPITAHLYDEFNPSAGSIISQLNESYERSTFILIYMTQKLFEDKWTKLCSETCLMDSIDNEDKKWCIVPVYPKKKNSSFRVPLFFNHLKGINYYHINDNYKKNVAKMIKEKVYVRLRRIEKQKQQQKNWLQQYKQDHDKTKKKENRLDRIQQSQADSVIQLPQADSVIQPSQPDSVIQPSQADSEIQQSQADSVIQLPQADSVIQPSQADSVIQQSQADSVIQPSQADSGIQQSQANGGIQQFQADGRLQQSKADGRSQQSKADGGIQQSKANGGIQQSQADGRLQQSQADGRIQQSQADGGIQQSQADGRLQQSKADGRIQQSKADGRSQQSQADGEIQQSQADGGIQQSQAANTGSSRVSLEVDGESLCGKPSFPGNQMEQVGQFGLNRTCEKFQTNISQSTYVARVAPMIKNNALESRHGSETKAPSVFHSGQIERWGDVKPSDEKSDNVLTSGADINILRKDITTVQTVYTSENQTESNITLSQPNENYIIDCQTAFDNSSEFMEPQNGQPGRARTVTFSMSNYRNASRLFYYDRRNAAKIPFSDDPLAEGSIEAITDL